MAERTQRIRRAWLGRLHPVAKLLWLLGLGVGVFFVSRPALMLAILLALLVTGWTAGLRKPRDLRGGRLLLWSGLALFLLQALFYRQGDPLLTLEGWFRVTEQGVARGLLVSGRFLIILLSSQLFVVSTDPSDLAYGLMQTGLPYRYGFALVTALRLMPLFEGEARTVQHAQLVRAVRYDRRALPRAYDILRQLLLPLLVSALRKVDVLAVSMEGRHFGRYRDRTYLRRVDWAWADTLSLLLLTALLAALLAARPVIEGSL